MKRIVVLIIFLLSLTTLASAQAITLPGSVWTANGTTSPVEKDNLNSQTHIEQGISFKHFEVFGQFTGGYDAKGFDWNRHTLLGIGARYTLNITGGMVRASYSYLAEHRYVSNSQASGPSFVVDAWFGWNLRPTR